MQVLSLVFSDSHLNQFVLYLVLRTRANSSQVRERGISILKYPLTFIIFGTLYIRNEMSRSVKQKYYHM